MQKESYGKGNIMTFPLELTQLQPKESAEDNKYLYPPEVLKIQALLEEECDKMEYDGSFMYDNYPDKVRVQHMADYICKKVPKEDCERIRNAGLEVLTQIMLCNEMSFRRQRRKCHKRNMGKCVECRD